MLLNKLIKRVKRTLRWIIKQLGQKVKERLEGQTFLHEGYDLVGNRIIHNFSREVNLIALNFNAAARNKAVRGHDWRNISFERSNLVNNGLKGKFAVIFNSGDSLIVESRILSDKIGLSFEND